MTGHEIAFTAHARRSMKRLPAKATAAVLEFLYLSLAGNPQRVGKPLRFDLAGRRSARRGDYRIVYVIDEDHRRVVVDTVEHRSDAYRPRS